MDLENFDAVPAGALASRLLAGGPSLKEVADVLRHRSLNTTLNLRAPRADPVETTPRRIRELRASLGGVFPRVRACSGPTYTPTSRRGSFAARSREASA